VGGKELPKGGGCFNEECGKKTGIGKTQGRGDGICQTLQGGVLTKPNSTRVGKKDKEGWVAMTKRHSRKIAETGPSLSQKKWGKGMGGGLAQII